MAKNNAPRERFRADSLPAVFQMIEQVEKKLKRMTRETTRAAGLTPSQFAVLSSLWGKDGVPFKDLAAANWCTRPTMTGIVDTLEKKGLVVRERNPDDRRSLLVCLTDKGRGMQKKARSMEAVFKNCCDGLSTAEVKQLGELLEKLDQSLS